MNGVPVSTIHWIVLILLAAIAFAGVKFRKLTPAAGIMGFLVACIIYLGTYIFGVVLLSLFFGLGVAASRWKREEKQNTTMQDTAEARRPGQVLANAGVAALIAFAFFVVSYWYPAFQFIRFQWPLVFPFMLAGSLASATADTLSSELGVIYSRKFYNCLTLKPDVKGLDGVISIEGLAIGACGSFIIALAAVRMSDVWYYYGNYRYKYLLVITLAGIIGNYADSVLGAALERKGMLSNNQVNFLSTLIAALSVWLMLLL